MNKADPNTRQREELRLVEKDLAELKKPAADLRQLIRQRMEEPVPGGLSPCGTVTRAGPQPG